MKPSLPVILWNDWPALASWIGVLVTWALYGGALFLKGEQEVALFFLPAIAVTLMCAALGAWRIRRVQALFRGGREVAGQITGVWIVRDRGRLEFRYRVGDMECHGWTPVHKTARVLAFATGQAVRVLVNPANPRQAIVRELYAGAAVTALRTR
jgi:hypothetical protein